MSVALTPSNSLGFNRPLTQIVKRNLAISNTNAQPIAFKVKTTAPKLYCVRPNSGRVEPGETVEVSVMLQAMKEEPPLNAKCKDKFLIQSTLITPEKETMALHDIWATPEGSEEAKVHQQKLRVTYLPANGGPLEEEDESFAQQATIHPAVISPPDSRFETVPRGGGFVVHQEPPIPDFGNETSHFVPNRMVTPANDFTVAREDSNEDLSQSVPQQVLQPQQQQFQQQEQQEQQIEVPVQVQRQASNAAVFIPPSPPRVNRELSREKTPEREREIPLPPPIVETRSTQLQSTPPRHSVPVPESQPSQELTNKLNLANAEIERLRNALASASSVAAPSEFRRRRGGPQSDDGSEAGTDVVTVVDDGPLHQDGVPLQVVVIIALGVFITTYLFF